ncbi:MAG TPA: DEAD/DEAH box helicase [Virgibacillus sp.]|nr:DEAD/DEAH box helicase [Virgibacillus sp.]
MSKNFEQFSFNETMLNVIKQLNFSEPTPIQEKVMSSIMEGRSIVGQSHTGSGKTHAFLLPLFNQINTDKREVQFVVTAPTRELALQLYQEVKKIITYAGKEDEWLTKLISGGSDKHKMAAQLKQPPHIVVGTPGRILDMVKSNALSIYSATTFIIDEADLMLDLGFIDEVDQLLVTSKGDAQILAFSATIPQRLEHFFKKYLKNPLYVKVDDQLSPDTIEHQLIAKRHRSEAKIITDLSKVIQPYLAIIFTNGKAQADELAAALQKAGLEVGIMHGDLSPRERKRTLRQIQDLRYQYVVATDLASRGIDIKGVSHVINAQLPKEEHFYVHRVGRTARAGMDGMAISLYSDEDLPLIQLLEKKGVAFNFSDVRNKEWVKAKPWNKRALRKETTTNIEQEAWKQVRRPKEVKPGYKKKMKKEQEAIKKRMLGKSKGKRY